MRTKQKPVGRYIVTDKRVCHGQPTFRGTRVLVADVLDQVASGMAWEAIVEEWRGKVSQEGIAEAIRLAREALIARMPPPLGALAALNPALLRV